MGWECEKCFCTKYLLAETGHVSCINCQNKSKPTCANEVVSVSPGPNQSLENSSVGFKRQSSTDKTRKLLRGAAKRSKASMILKHREEIGDPENLIDTNDLKYTEGVYIQDRVLRSKKARVLKAKIEQAAFSLKRQCGYSVKIDIQAPLPSSGPRADGLTMDLKDINGEHAVQSTCSLSHAEDSVPAVKVNRGTMFLKCVEGNYEKKLTPTKQRLAEIRRNSGVDMASPTSSSLSQSLVDYSDDKPEPSSPTLLDEINSSSSSLESSKANDKPSRPMFVPPPSTSKPKFQFKTSSCSKVFKGMYSMK